MEQKTVDREKRMLFSGVAVLTLANLCVKIFGFLYKVPLNAMLGDEMANINTAYAIYTLLYTISTAGIPSAVALFISSARATGDRAGIKKLLFVSLYALLGIGFLMMLLLLVLAWPLSWLNSGGDSYLCMLAIAPSLFFVAAASVFRGYFQGFQNMRPTAVSELIESGGKLLFGLALVWSALHIWGLGGHVAAALSIGGITLGIALGAGYLAICFWRTEKKGGLPLLTAQKEGTPPQERHILRQLLSVALPIAATSAMLNLSGLVDSQLMRPLLARYYGDEGLAKAIYSDYSTGALTLYNLPGILIYPIAAGIVPYIASSLALGRRRSAMSAMTSAFRVAALIALPCAVGLCLFATPILRFVFRGDEDMARHAGPLLAVLSVCVFFAALLTVTNAVLQAVHKEKRPIIAVGIGLVIKLLATVFLTGRMGAVGTPVATFLFFAAVCGIDLYFLKKETGASLAWGQVLFKPLLAALFGVGGGFLLFLVLLPRLGNSISLLLGIGVSFVLYIPAVFASGSVTKADLALLPWGQKLLMVWESSQKYVKNNQKWPKMAKKRSGKGYKKS